MSEAELRPRDGREHDRFSLEIGVTVDVSGGAPIEATLKNVSYGGLSLEVPVGALPLGGAVDVCLPLEPGVTLKLGGVVCWRRGNDVGVRFEGLRRAARLAVQAMVNEARSAGGGSPGLSRTG